MQPLNPRRPALPALLLLCSSLAACSHSNAPPPAAPAVDPTVAPEHAPPVVPSTVPQSPPLAPPTGASTSSSCLSSGDGYFRARLGGAIDATINWPNAGTHCEGESKLEPAGIRVSFKRDAAGQPDLLFVFGITGITPGMPSHAAGANLTVIEQGTSRIFGTQGDSRCTVDSLVQRQLPGPHAYRVEARGFCTSPAHAIRGDGDVLMSTFEFAGVVNFDPPSATAQARTTP